jgi:hypothetical protein
VPGSYYLTTNLTATGVAGQHGITISADHVTLDLNGFSLIGVAGSGDGIRVPAARLNLVIYNGTVRNSGEVMEWMPPRLRPAAFMVSVLYSMAGLG